MKIVVCIKQVPNTNEVRINNETGTLIRDGVESIINPDDLNALEEAIKIKEARQDVHITVITMGPAQADSALREALAMGADEAILISDRVFAGSDTWATATVLSSAIKKIKDYDVVFCGRQAIDGDTAQVGPEIAEFLGIPQITYVKELKVYDDKVVATRAYEEGSFVIESKMPVLLTAIKELNEPRFMDLRLIYKAYSEEADCKVWSAEDIEVDVTQIGVKNSPTKVYKTYVPVKEFSGELINGNPKDVAVKCVEEINNLNLI
ncbi:electron transfer flavoprotein subunit beta [Vallitalea longa]|uniref:Electron transfer flavoprotein small subunit n=1 Tax=Vallitalea longa TaxID=2936439 RepID=A0A9W5YBS7_9FIRM|nr:electron transfer flavoprotein subunit beta/FixA family protein [Vallitalea longa]GKX29591.1 electron transfer flavoprotein subunit beta [Vallitalea longa]